MIVQVWGKQNLQQKPVNKAGKEGQTTKAIIMSEAFKKGSAAGNVKNVSWKRKSQKLFFFAIPNYSFELLLPKIKPVDM